MLAILTAFLALTNPNAASCATISNIENTATWTNARGRTITAKYDGDNLTPQGLLIFSRPVTVQVRQAEAALQYGKPGPKTITVCS